MNENSAVFDPVQALTVALQEERNFWRQQYLEMQSRFAEQNERIARALEAIGVQLEDRPDNEKLIDKREAAKLLECSPETIKRYHLHWNEGIHYFTAGRGAKTLYSKYWITHWRDNRNYLDEHRRTVAEYAQSKAARGFAL